MRSKVKMSRFGVFIKLILVVCVQITASDNNIMFLSRWTPEGMQCVTADLRPGKCTSNCTALTPEQRLNDRNICGADEDDSYFCCPKDIVESTPYPAIVQACNDRETMLSKRLKLREKANEKLMDLQTKIYNASLEARQDIAEKFYGFLDVCKREAIKIGGINRKDKERRRNKMIFKEFCETFKMPDEPQKAAGGLEATLGEFPYMAALGWTYTSTYHNYTNWACGGTLIHTSFVLTAAHCIFNLGEPPNIVRIGDVDLTKDDDDKHSVEYDIEEVFVHNQYDRKTYYNDIALLKVKKKDQFRNKYSPLPACVWLEDEFPVEQLGLIGYGAPAFGRTFTEKLYKGGLEVVANEECTEYYSENPSVPQGIMPSQICALDPNGIFDTCQGDSGGPLQFELRRRKRTALEGSDEFQPKLRRMKRIVFEGSDKLQFPLKRRIPYVAAITSFGKQCVDGVPGVYTKVSSFLSWIEEKLSENQ